ncbi:MAG: hypothetical protein PHS14_03905 [Elusimicrobia bacterium]|nr:hypothetical protein [Elusimicrobiota bacterium]
MKTLSLIVVAAVSFGAVALSGCNSCSQQPAAAQPAASQNCPSNLFAHN